MEKQNKCEEAFCVSWMQHFYYMFNSIQQIVFFKKKKKSNSTVDWCHTFIHHVIKYN